MGRLFSSWACVFALVAVPLVGCSEETAAAGGTGGSGDTRGDGGTGGGGGDGGACETRHECDDRNDCTRNAWVGESCENTAVDDGTACGDENECAVSACASGVCDSTPVRNGASCTQHPFADVEGTCIEGRCTVSCDTAEDCMSNNECAVGVCDQGTCDSTPVQNGTLCSLHFDQGNCFAGECTEPCDTAEDCFYANDCFEYSCLQADGGSRCDFRALADGTSCAGGTCQLGACQVTRLDIPCTQQGYFHAVYAGCGPYTFDCDRPTVIPVGDLVFTKDVILDGGGNLIIERGLVTDGASVELRRFVIVANRIFNGGGNLRVVNTTVKNDGEDTGGFLSMIRGALTLTGCTVLSSEEIEIVSDDGVVLVANSTLSFGSEGGSISSVSGESEVTVTNSTLRSRGVFPVIAVAADAPPATVTATIVDGECLGLIHSDGYNIESPGNTCGFDQTGDQVNVSADDLKLGPLQDNGGPTMTRALGDGSVAIDVIPIEECEVETDQRGQPRPETDGTMCDVGAFEVQP